MRHLIVKGKTYTIYTTSQHPLPLPSAFLHRHLRLHMQQACLLHWSNSDTEFIHIFVPVSLCVQVFSYIKCPQLCTSRYTLNSSYILDCKEIKRVNPKGNQALNIHWKDWCWSSNTLANSRLIRKDPDAGTDWRQQEKGSTEDEMAGWHHWLNGREFEWTPGDGSGQGGLVYCNSWGRKELDRT